MIIGTFALPRSLAPVTGISTCLLEPVCEKRWGSTLLCSEALEGAPECPEWRDEGFSALRLSLLVYA